MTQLCGQCLNGWRLAGVGGHLRTHFEGHLRTHHAQGSSVHALPGTREGWAVGVGGA